MGALRALLLRYGTSLRAGACGVVGESLRGPCVEGCIGGAARRFPIWPVLIQSTLTVSDSPGKVAELSVPRATACWSELVLEKNLGQNLVKKVFGVPGIGGRSGGGGAGRTYYLSAQRSWADCRLMPTARPMSAQEAPAAFAAATVLSSLLPAWVYSRAAASTPRMASVGAM